MNKSINSLISRVLSFSFIACAFISCSDEPSDNSKKGECVSRSIDITESERQASVLSNVFAWNLLEECMAEEEVHNVVISPMSANICLSMIANGASGESRAQMLDVLGFGESDMEDVNSLNSKIARQICSLDDNITISLANSFWYQKSVDPKSAFLKDLKNSYDIESYVINPSTFASDANNWCNKKTKGLVPKVIDNNSEAVCAFLNALYFKGFWNLDYRFDKNAIMRDNFYGSKGMVSKVSFMCKQSVYSYHRDELWRAISIPFSGGGFYFTVVLPFEGVSFDECMSSIKDFEPATAQFRPQDLKLRLPKINIKHNQDLIEVLKHMGMKDIFDASAADFSNLSDYDMYVNVFKQNVSFELDEDGAEAAAVTSGELILTSPGPQVPDDIFYVDHPFIFMISEKSTGTILFMGRINQL